MGDMVQIWPGGLIGHRIVQKDGESSKVEGAILALRESGNEALFACSVEDSNAPAEWIPISSFVVNPIAIATEEDFYEEEPLGDGSVDAVPEEHGPMGAPHKMRVLRRGETT